MYWMKHLEGWIIMKYKHTIDTLNAFIRNCLGYWHIHTRYTIPWGGFKNFFTFLMQFNLPILVL